MLVAFVDVVFFVEGIFLCTVGLASLEVGNKVRN